MDGETLNCTVSSNFLLDTVPSTVEGFMWIYWWQTVYVLIDVLAVHDNLEDWQEEITSAGTKTERESFFLKRENNSLLIWNNGEGTFILSDRFKNFTLGVDYKVFFPVTLDPWYESPGILNYNDVYGERMNTLIEIPAAEISLEQNSID